MFKQSEHNDSDYHYCKNTEHCSDFSINQFLLHHRSSGSQLNVLADINKTFTDRVSEVGNADSSVRLHLSVCLFPL